MTTNIMGWLWERGEGGLGGRIVDLILWCAVAHPIGATSLAAIMER